MLKNQRRPWNKAEEINLISRSFADLLYIVNCLLRSTYRLEWFQKLYNKPSQKHTLMQGKWISPRMDWPATSIYLGLWPISTSCRCASCTVISSIFLDFCHRSAWASRLLKIKASWLVRLQHVRSVHTLPNALKWDCRESIKSLNLSLWIDDRCAPYKVDFLNTQLIRYTLVHQILHTLFVFRSRLINTIFPLFL